MTAMDHIVLNVEKMDAVLDFYMNVLGLESERLDEFRQGKVPFPSVRINADTVIDLFPLKEPVPATATPLRTDLNHFCMVIGKD
ncbi:MAG: VOC family protein, partial [Candidatus Tectomicrobia bacterium]|nr:VOC family protein [Candidatus Tectomicrobia bacterium]